MRQASLYVSASVFLRNTRASSYNRDNAINNRSHVTNNDACLAPEEKEKDNHNQMRMFTSCFRPRYASTASTLCTAL